VCVLVSCLEWSVTTLSTGITLCQLYSTYTTSW